MLRLKWSLRVDFPTLRYFARGIKEKIVAYECVLSVRIDPSHRPRHESIPG